MRPFYAVVNLEHVPDELMDQTVGELERHAWTRADVELSGAPSSLLVVRRSFDDEETALHAAPQLREILGEHWAPAVRFAPDVASQLDVPQAARGTAMEPSPDAATSATAPPTLGKTAETPAMLLLRERPLKGIDEWSPGAAKAETPTSSGTEPAPAARSRATRLEPARHRRVYQPGGWPASTG